MWNEFYDFANQVQPDCSNANLADDCWNSALDEFVEYARNKTRAAA